MFYASLFAYPIFPRVQTSSPTNSCVSVFCSISLQLYDFKHSNFSRLQWNNRPKARRGRSRFNLQCEICLRLYADQVSFQAHKELHEKNFACLICGENLFSQEKFNEHKCPKTLKKDTKIQESAIEDLKPMTCEICQKVLKGVKNLKNHQRVHSGNQPCVCSHCGKKFWWKCNLEDHERLHTGEKPYVCQICSKSFGSKKMLRGHIRCIHEIGPVLCEVCGKGISRNSYRSHLKTHQAIKPFKCNFCPKRFLTRPHVEKHLVVHTREKPFECELCLERFTQQSSLKLHVKVLHSDERPYVCSICHKGFAITAHLRTHAKTHRN